MNTTKSNPVQIQNSITQVSVVVTLHNGESWIKACLDSLISQTHSCELEIIVVDDASTDRSREVVKGFADPRVRIVEIQPNVGVAEARNRGVDEARFDWIAFNDQDDVWLPTKLEDQIQLLERHPNAKGCVGANGRLASDSVSQWSFSIGPWRWTPVDIPHLRSPPWFDPLFDGHVYLQSLLVRRDVAQMTRFRFGLKLMEDIDFLMRLGSVAKLVCVSKPVFLYRLSFENTTAPGKMRAQEFLANQAYIRLVTDARRSGNPDPTVDPTQFLAAYVPDPRAVQNFTVAQGFRLFNTTWVARGLPRALGVLAIQLIRHPIGAARYILTRVKHWLNH